MPFQLGRLGLHEMDHAARIHRAAFDERLPWLAGLHTPDEDRAFFRNHVFGDCEVWGALEGDALVGFMALRAPWIHQLYVLPNYQRQGVGSALITLAQANSARLTLWTFQRNTGARRFYEAHHFRPGHETDGSENQEREPDVLYEWERQTQAPRRAAG